MPDHMLFNEHLTKAPHDAAIRQTFLGQAHIAGTGPEGATCRECAFWHKWKSVKRADGAMDRVPTPPGYFGKSAATPNCLKKAKCNRPVLNKPNKMIPHNAKACRLFEANAEAPSVAKPTLAV